MFGVNTYILGVSSKFQSFGGGPIKETHLLKKNSKLEATPNYIVIWTLDHINIT
jgi:hypothetical protein